LDDISYSSDDFADAFEFAFARFQVAIEEACVVQAEWPEKVAAGIRAAFDLAATDPAAVRALTTDEMASGHAGFLRYDRMISHFAEQLLPGRHQRAEGRHLPEITERAMASGVVTLIAQRVDRGRHAELPGLAPEATQFVLTPYLGAVEARRIAT